MSRKGKRRKPMAEINVVPYIDVTLVLLIIFMITTPLLQTGVEVDLPNAEAKTVEPKKDPPLIIAIEKNGEYHLTLGLEPEQLVEESEVTPKVMAVIAEKPDTPVFIRGDDAVDYGKVVTAMASLKKAGVRSVGLMTDSKQH